MIVDPTLTLGLLRIISFLETPDHTRFPLRTDVARETIRMFAGCADLNGEDAVTHVPDSSPTTLKLVVDYCEFHYNNPDPSQAVVQEWDRNLLSLEQR
ncbi:hypothetical protein D9758_011107 [Tetrapyrgos nigripes]|uniref:SKP1 component POZ domain-containing protein n=1 Tax=Tetrapyrgos nigripes TaxID=182062 RepID=A0A8H5CUA1_9AGAR|nr:hypothetical protein D9758_011107 [Tetrapyrgos nigripes]